MLTLRFSVVVLEPQKFRLNEFKWRVCLPVLLLINRFLVKAALLSMQIPQCCGNWHRAIKYMFSIIASVTE